MVSDDRSMPTELRATMNPTNSSSTRTELAAILRPDRLRVSREFFSR